MALSQDNIVPNAPWHFAAEKPEMNDRSLQSLATDQFFYFFLRLRKSEIRRTVQILRNRYPHDNPEQLARRLIEAKTRLTLIGGMMLHIPMLMPGVGQVLKLIGMVGGMSVLTRMNLYLILEIALVYGKDIDDTARVPEMTAVVAATGLAAASPMLVHALEWHPLYALPVGGLAATGMTRMIGDSTIRYYRGQVAALRSPEPSPAAS
jgi:hypothetical protein